MTPISNKHKHHIGRDLCSPDTLKMFVLAGMCLFVFVANADTTSSPDSPIATGKTICQKGYFQCENHTICVPQNEICDKHENCPGGSDEKHCDDNHKFEFYDHMFRKNPSAEHDDDNNTCQLSYNGTECLCRGRDLYCPNRNFGAAPAFIPQEFINILDFTGNNFTILSADSLHNVPRQTERLILKHCNILKIDEKAFYKLNGLKKIYLDNNDLKKFPASIFSAENMLEYLIISYNDIATIQEGAFNNLTSLLELDLRGNKIVEIRSAIFEPLERLNILYLQNNQIDHIYHTTFPRLPFLQLMSLSENKISLVDPEAFKNLDYLHKLYLSHNRLGEIRNRTFQNLTRLESLTLNDNKIKVIEIGVFLDVPNINSLTLDNNQFRMLDNRVLAPLLKLEHIYFDRFEMCAAAAHVRNCNPKGDGISSRHHLLDNSILRASVWIMGAIGCTGNLIVFLGRLLSPTNNIVHSLYLRNLAMSDLLMGIYLFVIAIVDQEYRGVYLQHEYKWRHSYLCNICGFLSTLSCESSVLILTLVTWDRFISVTQPLARKQPSPRAATLTLLILWILAALVALAPLSHIAGGYFGDEFYGSNGVCLSLHIHEPYAMGWEYSAAMFVLVNTLALIFICYAYVRMINEIKASGVACRSTRQSQDRDKVAQRFGIIVLTDCLCWVPVIIIKLLALSGMTIPQDLYAWLAIFVLPINSALNPVLYTLTTTVFIKQVRKIANACIYRRKRPDHCHSASESGFSLSFGVFPIGGSTRKVLTHRGTQSSFTASKSSWKRSTAV